MKQASVSSSINPISPDQIFAVYKPKGPTSHDIINKIRRLTNIKKVGHAGTLDPLAKGILIIAVGNSTKKLATLVKKDKEYLATIKLGQTSTTDDREGKIKKFKITQHPNSTHIREILATFKGQTLQVPPKYSAVKVKGVPAYKLARSKQNFTLKSKKITIKTIKLLSYSWPYLKIKVVTGPGVYIRALARDIGQKLNTGAYLYSLERTRVGEFDKTKALKLE